MFDLAENVPSLDFYVGRGSLLLFRSRPSIILPEVSSRYVITVDHNRMIELSSTTSMIGTNELID